MSKQITDRKELLTEIPIGGHSPAASVIVLTTGKQIFFTELSLSNNGVESWNNGISFAKVFGL